jgi:predicted secreted protein
VRRLSFAVISICGVACALVIAGCTDEPSADDVTAEVGTADVVFDDPEGPITVGDGSRFSIVLPSNPTTGYRWSVEQPGGGTVALVGDEPEYRPGSSDLAGAGGDEIFRFEATEPGTVDLVFTYARSFDPDDAPTVRTVNVTVE